MVLTTENKYSTLGQTTEYTQTYSPHLLDPIPRALGRSKIDLKDPLPFTGMDIWNGFELSWLNPKGKPEIATSEFYFPHSTPNVIESKSLKLYLNSFNQTPFDSFERVEDVMKSDLSQAAGGDVEIKLIHPKKFSAAPIENFSGITLDNLDIETNTYNVNPNFLFTHPEIVEETLHSHLLKSNCLATGQPDWGSVYIRYRGKKIDHEGLLKYIISYRNHSGFAEHCVEKMFCDILRHCHPELLTIYIRYTKRGGLDINPFRSNFESSLKNFRLWRQ